MVKEDGRKMPGLSKAKHIFSNKNGRFMVNQLCLPYINSPIRIVNLYVPSGHVSSDKSVRTAFYRLKETCLIALIEYKPLAQDNIHAKASTALSPNHRLTYGLF